MQSKWRGHMQAEEAHLHMRLANTMLATDEVYCDMVLDEGEEGRTRAWNQTKD